MTTKNSDALKFLESITGGPLTFGETLCSIRMGEELSMEAFAERLSISRSHLNDIEKDRKGVSPERAAAFARRLGYPEAVFVEVALQDELRRSGLKLKVRVA